MRGLSYNPNLDNHDLLIKLQDTGNTVIRACNQWLLVGRRRAALVLPLLRQLADPRGRCNTNTFLRIALTFLALQSGVAALMWQLNVEVSGICTLLMNAPILWIGTTCSIKRLHDVGRSGWYLPGAFAVWFVTAFLVAMIAAIVLGEAALDEGQPVFYAMFAAVTLPAFGALIWLHTAKSTPHANVYGPIASGNGLSMPMQFRRAGPARTYYAAGVLA